jgi:hypothetical protein
VRLAVFELKRAIKSGCSRVLVDIYLVMLLSALGRISFPFLRVPLTFPRTFSMTRYEYIRLPTQYHLKLLGNGSNNDDVT